MPNSETSRMERYVRYALGALAILFIILVVFLVVDYRQLRREQAINAREMWLSAVLRHHGPLNVNEASVIRSWMTFDYINKTFGLPADYLKTQLQVADSRYPKLSLASYIKEQDLNSVLFTSNVITAVQTYLELDGASATSTPPTTFPAAQQA